MAESRKKLSLSQIFGITGEGTGWRSWLVERPRAYIALARERMKDLPKTNYDLGYKFASEGKWMDAIFRFKVVLYLNPNYPNAHYNLGCCYMRMGKAAEAKAAFIKALKQSPGNMDVLFMLTSLDPNAVPSAQRPTRMPLEMVTSFFAAQSEGYDITEANNRYQAGKVIYELVKPQVKTAAPMVLDLGCGSGIASRPWRAEAASIRGVDVTPSMLALADKATHAEKKLFDGLSTADIAQLPAELNNTADLVLMVNVVQFIGELSTTMNSAAQTLKDGGILVVTAETFGPVGYGLVSTTSRFGHSNAYIKQVATSAGLTFVSETAVELYAGIPAQALVFSKGSK